MRLFRRLCKGRRTNTAHILDFDGTVYRPEQESYAYQFDIVAVPGLLTLLTHMHTFWVAGAACFDRLSRLWGLVRQEPDGCYVLETDLAQTAASNEIIHERYKDLAIVEWAFRQSETVHLEMRPIHVRLESRTRGHAFVVMLAITQALAKYWRHLDLNRPGRPRPAG